MLGPLWKHLKLLRTQHPSSQGDQSLRVLEGSGLGWAT